MHIRTVGSDGYRTSAVGFGCMGLSQGYGPVDDSLSSMTIHAALDAGVTGFDTAMSYGGGDNEQFVGATLRASGVARDQLQIATKFGINRGSEGVHLDADPTKIAGWCEASLRRLGVDYIDLYYLHRVDPDIPIEDSVGAMADLAAAGKIRYLGVSEVTPEQLVRAHQTHSITAVQTEWSLMWREPEVGIVPTARRLGVGLVPYSPLGRGLLGGRLTAQAEVSESPFRASDPRFNGEDLVANLAQVQALRGAAATWHMQPAQLALAWLLAQGDDLVPIPGSRRPERATENAGSADIDLTDKQLAQLDSMVPPRDWLGDRASFAVPVTQRPTPS